MTAYNFELTFKLNQGETGEDYIDALYGAGCDDALVGVGRQGYLGIEFSRNAKSAYDAITNALRDVRQAIPHARLIEIGPDLVGLTDMGTLFNVSRQYMRQLIVDNLEAPAPIHSGSPNLWSFCSVLAWMYDNDLMINRQPIDESLLELARMTHIVNIVRYFLVSITEDQFPDEETVAKCARQLPPSIRRIVNEDDLRLIA